MFSGELQHLSTPCLARYTLQTLGFVYLSIGRSKEKPFVIVAIQWHALHPCTPHLITEPSRKPPTQPGRVITPSKSHFHTDVISTRTQTTQTRRRGMGRLGRLQQLQHSTDVGSVTCVIFKAGGGGRYPVGLRNNCSSYISADCCLLCI